MAKLMPEALKHKTIRLPEVDRRPVGKTKRERRDTLYADLWRYQSDHWHETARTYEANPQSFYNAWHYLADHPIFWRLRAWSSSAADNVPLNHMRHLESGYAFTDGSIWQHVTRVNPATGRVHDDKALNTRTEVWLEAGEWSWAVQEEHHITTDTHYHNHDLATGGVTFEEAVIHLARNVWKKYGNDRRKCAPEYHDKKRARADKRIKGRGFPGKMLYEPPYNHMCRHTDRPGIQGQIQRLDFAQWQKERLHPGTSVEGITRDMSSAARRLLDLTAEQQTEVWHRLDDEAFIVLHAGDLAESLEQMKHGDYEGRHARNPDHEGEVAPTRPDSDTGSTEQEKPRHGAADDD